MIGLVQTVLFGVLVEQSPMAVGDGVKRGFGVSVGDGGCGGHVTFTSTSYRTGAA